MKSGAILALILLTFVFVGCQSVPDPGTSSPASASVSAIPWNKPASWEGAGALGGFTPQGGGH